MNNTILEPFGIKRTRTIIETDHHHELLGEEGGTQMRTFPINGGSIQYSLGHCRKNTALYANMEHIRKSAKPVGHA